MHTSCFKRLWHEDFSNSQNFTMIFPRKQHQFNHMSYVIPPTQGIDQNMFVCLKLQHPQNPMVYDLCSIQIAILSILNYIYSPIYPHLPPCLGSLEAVFASAIYWLLPPFPTYIQMFAYYRFPCVPFKFTSYQQKKNLQSTKSGYPPVTKHG